MTLQGEIQSLKAASLFHTLKEEDLKIISLTTKNVIYEPLEVLIKSRQPVRPGLARARARRPDYSGRI